MGASRYNRAAHLSGSQKTFRRFSPSRKQSPSQALAVHQPGIDSETTHQQESPDKGNQT